MATDIFFLNHDFIYHLFVFPDWEIIRNGILVNIYIYINIWPAIDIFDSRYISYKCISIARQLLDYYDKPSTENT